MSQTAEQHLRKDLEKKLRQEYLREVRDSRDIKLPSTLGIEAEGDGLLLRLSAKSVTSNMQTDEAAFEAWALALRLWLREKVPHILLDWKTPRFDESVPADRSRKRHYQRFLYRVAQFRTLFPEWFRVAAPHKPEECEALTELHPLINVASVRNDDFEPKTTSREYEVEQYFVKSRSLHEHYNLEFADRQFPVGLFRDQVSSATRIFTGGKSAIDIVGVGKDKRFFIFELKAGDNDKAGILSELLLYTSLIREAAHSRQRITFADKAKSRERPAVDSNDVRNCTGIHAVMLVERLHPLLEHPHLLDTLNRAAEARWNHDPEAKPVSFSVARIEEGGPDEKWNIQNFETASKARA